MAIPETIKKLANDIRTKIYGREVRESLAKGIEEAGDIADQTRERQDSVEAQFQSVLDETTGKDVISAPEITAARIGADDTNHPNLKERLDTEYQKLSSQLADEAIERTNRDVLVSSNIGKLDWWSPPRQPAFNSTDTEYDTSKGSFPMEQDNYSYDWIIDRAWDKFIRDSTLNNYVTKETLGKDQSGLYNIYRYVFTPENYEKTIILSAVLHGWEVTGTGILSRLMHHVCYDFDKYPHMAYLRNKVRIVILPFVNPWGWMNGINTRGNSRGVDLNRNFDYAWSRYNVSNPSYDYKGTNINSEIETQYVVDTLNQFSDAVAYLDFHNVISSSNIADFYIYSSTMEASAKDIATEILNQMALQGHTTINSSTIYPSGFNYAQRLDMHGLNPEVAVGGINSATPYGADEMTKWVEFGANIIIKYSQLSKPSTYNNKEPFTFYLQNSWVTNGMVLSNAYTEINLPSYTFNVPCDGVLLVDYSVVYRCSDDTAHTVFLPLLGQVGTSFVPSKQNTQWEVFEDTVGVGKRQNTAFCASIPVNKTLEDGSNYCKVGLYAKSSVASVTEILRARVQVTFIPSNGAKRHRLMYINSSGVWEDVAFSGESLITP